MQQEIGSLEALLDSLQGKSARERGVFLGDDHGVQGSPDIIGYLCAHLPALKDKGVDTLFIEMLNTTPEQTQWLKNYNRGHDDEGQPTPTQQMVAQLDAWINVPRQRKAEAYLPLFEAARQCGIKIIGIEPSSRNPMFPVGSSTREWERAVNAYLTTHDVGAYLIFGGMNHSHYYNQLSGLSDADSTEGIDRMLGIPCVLFSRNARTSHEEAAFGNYGFGPVPTYNIALPDRAKPGHIQGF